MCTEHVSRVENNDIFVDLNLGTACNFRCEYCFEQGCYTSEVMRPEVLDRFLGLAKTVLDSGVGISVCFWGGEPMLYMDAIKKTIDALGNYDLARFMLYTNGWFVRQNERTLDEFVVKCGGRFALQISHDFMPMGFNHRVLPGKKQDEVDEHVLDAFRWCDAREINFTAKSTATMDDLERRLFEQYKTFEAFRDTLRHRDNFLLAITPDTSNTKPVDENLLGEQLRSLLVHFAKSKKQNTGFVWFDNPGKVLCSGGARSFIVDVDGTVYPCHRCVYGWGENHDRMNTGYTSVFDDNVLYKIEHNVIVRNNLCDANAQCAACDTLLCFRCNAHNCGGDLMRWNASNHQAQCNMFKFISKYISAYQQMRKEW